MAGVLITLVGSLLIFDSPAHCETVRNDLVSKLMNRTLTGKEAQILVYVDKQGCGPESYDLESDIKGQIRKLIYNDDKIYYSYQEYKND